MKNNKSQITYETVKKLAGLAKLDIDQKQTDELTRELELTLNYVSELQRVDTTHAKETSQVTGLVNVTREDEIDTQRIFSQKQALKNAKKTHNGFFVVERVLDEKI